MSVNQEYQRACPLCQAQAVTLNKPGHSQPYAYHSVWARDVRDEPTPNAWSYVQMMMGVDGWMSPASSLIDTVRELADVVEDGNDTPVFAYDFSVEPTEWHSPGEKPSATVIVKCLAGEQTCDRAWLLDQLRRLVSTFEQEDSKARAAQYQPVIDVARNALRWRPERSTAEIPKTWGKTWPTVCSLHCSS